MYRKSMRSALAEARAYTEANMKRILQALQDKLSKEGGAAGFDDLKKTAKSMGLNLTPQMLKNMPGIKQHRDGDYILEQKKYMLTYGKKGEKVTAFYANDFSDVQKKASELRGKGFVVDKMGLTQPMSKLRDRIPEELDTDLEEAFSKKDFQKLEQSNDHTEAAKKLIDMFGTSDEKKEMNDIKARHEKTGYISGKDYSRRIQLTNRYYSRLK